MSYEQPDNDAVDFTLEDYSQPDNDAVDFSLVEEEPADDETRGFLDEFSLPLGLDLPTQALTIQTMEIGFAVFLVGTLGLLGGVTAFLRNYLAGIVLMLAMVALLISGLLGIGLELFWVLVLATLFLLAMGMVVRWMAT